MDESTITFFFLVLFSFILYLLDTADLPGCWLNTPFRVSKATPFGQQKDRQPWPESGRANRVGLWNPCSHWDVHKISMEDVVNPTKANIN